MGFTVHVERERENILTFADRISGMHIQSSTCDEEMFQQFFLILWETKSGDRLVAQKKRREREKENNHNQPLCESAKKQALQSKTSTIQQWRIRENKKLENKT